MLSELDIQQIKTVMQESVDRRFVAGASLMVIKDGKEWFYHDAGYADIEQGKPIRRDSIFRMYSMTKPVTAAAVMLLFERGQVDLFDPVSLYLPGFKDQKVAVGDSLVPVLREMTVKDLLSMTSGLVYGGEDQAGKDTEALFQEIDSRLLSERPVTTLEAMNRLGGCALQFQPGSSWQYGTSADVLGAVVEAASGKRFSVFLKEEFFEPLGMVDTGFWLPGEKLERLVTTYADNGQGGLAPYQGNHLGIIGSMDREPAFESGGAGLVSTIDDYAKFATMLMQGGSFEGRQYFKAKTVAYLSSCTLTGAQQEAFDAWHTLSGHSYGNLMRVLTDPTKAGVVGSQGEYGWDGWLGAYFCNCPLDGVTILFMMQKTDSGTTRLTRKLRNIVMSGLAEKTV